MRLFPSFPLADPLQMQSFLNLNYSFKVVKNKKSIVLNRRNNYVLCSHTFEILNIHIQNMFLRKLNLIMPLNYSKSV